MVMFPHHARFTGFPVFESPHFDLSFDFGLITRVHDNGLTKKSFSQQWREPPCEQPLSYFLLHHQYQIGN